MTSIAVQRGAQIVTNYLRLYSWTRLLSTQEKLLDPEQLRKKLNKLRYRSQQRGLLELDILLGKWAASELPNMDLKTLNAFEELLQEETPSMYKWATGQEPYPERLQNNKVFMKFYNHVQQRVLDNSSKETRNKVRAEWIRGWFDKGNQ